MRGVREDNRDYSHGCSFAADHHSAQHCGLANPNDRPNNSAFRSTDNSADYHAKPDPRCQPSRDRLR
jgi:hypothetical protein